MLRGGCARHPPPGGVLTEKPACAQQGRGRTPGGPRENPACFPGGSSALSQECSRREPSGPPLRRPQLNAGARREPRETARSQLRWPVGQDGCEAPTPRGVRGRTLGAGWGCPVHRRRKAGAAPRPRDPEAQSFRPRIPASPPAPRARAPHAQRAGFGRADRLLQRLPECPAADRWGCAQARGAGPTAVRLERDLRAAALPEGA
ncbi:uncharacterized protein [Manis javanica]|uniref:uncharacterized protein isoform X1 n=1 Tax=Manis javanica TaxID=9974 RepID=UPI003C6D3E66